MSQKSSEMHNLPNAAPSAPPPAYQAHEFAHRAPPPSYEESQKMFVGGTMQQQQQQMPAALSPQFGMQPQPSAYGYYPGYQQQTLYSANMPIQQIHYQQTYGANVPTASPTQMATTPQMLTLAKGAKVRTTSTGAISIPPPPPGCAATPAQLAAMQGQPVLVRKQKKGFF